MQNFYKLEIYLFLSIFLKIEQIKKNLNRKDLILIKSTIINIF